MDFIENIKKIGENALRQKDLLHTEEATKNALIMPFIQALGYNVFDPREVRPEYTADIGTKKGEKVDYAIFKDDSPAILFECKASGIALDISHRDQLFRYFHAIAEAHFGVLTNGLMYQFYTDLDNKNRMDKEPFLEFDLSTIQETLGEELQKFTKANFNADALISRAEELKYTQKIKNILAKEYEAPTPEFVHVYMDRLGVGPKTAKRVKQYHRFVKKAFREFVREHSATANTVEPDNEPVAPEPATPPVPEEREWQPISEFDPQPSDPKPTDILFPDNSQVSIKMWKAIMVEVAIWLENKKLLNADHCPLLVRDNAKYYIISTNPEHLNGQKFRAEVKIGSIYLETGVNRSGSVSYTKRLIEHVGQDPAQFKIR